MTRWTARRWLRAFKATGGIAWLDRDDTLMHVGWRIYGWTDAQHAEARRLWGEIEAIPLRYDAARLQLALMG